MKISASRLPTVYLPHGGGPCFFMDGLGPQGTWDGMANWLRQFGEKIAANARALLVVSAHWEETAVTVHCGAKPALLYDYYGFPEHTYQIQYPAPGAPDVALDVFQQLESAGVKAEKEVGRGFDHGVFIPLKVALPDAQIPIVQLSLVAGLDPATHLAIGKALAPLRDKGVLIVGSGMSYHNLRNFSSGGGAEGKSFDDWLNVTATQCEPNERFERLAKWDSAPGARNSHPREEHLMPLMVCAGAAEDDHGTRVYNESVMNAPISAFCFGEHALTAC